MSTHVHGSPSLECTFEQQFGEPCPFEDRRFWPVNVCIECGRHFSHRPLCSKRKKTAP